MCTVYTSELEFYYRSHIAFCSECVLFDAMLVIRHTYHIQIANWKIYEN
jgi:hypothetical protein